MRNLLLVFFLGLLSAVHSTPLNTVTQIPAQPEEDYLKEAETDGFIIDRVHHPLLTTESPKINTTTQASQQPSFESTTERSGETSWLVESRGAGPTTTAQSILESTAEGSGETSWFVESRGTDPTTTVQSILESTAEGSGETSWLVESRGTDPTTTVQSILESTTEGSGETLWLVESRGTDPTTTTQSILESTIEGSGENLWFVESRGTDSTATVMSVSHSQNPDGSTSDSSIVNSLQSGFISSAMPNGANAAGSAVNTNKTRSFLLDLNLNKQASMKDTDQVSPLQAGKLEEVDNPLSNGHKGHSTPDWIIILGFIVGVAALVLLCAAIATRDKWNGPTQVFKDETKTNASNQMRELEMQTFLHKEEPKENGKEAEYTVIPLEDLPENFS